MKKKSSLSRLFEYAGNYKYLTILSWVLSAVSAWIALVPFYYIWRIIKEVLAVVPDYSQAQNLKGYGWAAVGFALLSMIIYVGSLMCSHVAAFHVQAEMRSQMMHHIVTLPMGFMDSEGSGKIRKIINESSEATETYLAHQLPDQTGAYATPVGLLVLLLVFDWRLGLLSLIPVVAAFLIMGSMTGEKMQQKMKEYQNALEEMSSEAVEYVRGIPVVKTFGQSVFSFKRFQTFIKNYEKWTISYTKDLRMPMVLYTTIINAVFSVLIATAKLAHCDEFAEKLPDGWNTMIGENGSELSGGERQRISIARAFLKDAPIILLDEATASLDVDNETMIQESLSRLIKNKTVMIIAHRMRTVADSDKIVVLKDGVVAEQGSPAELARKNGIYQHMMETQMQAAGWKL